MLIWMWRMSSTVPVFAELRLVGGSPSKFHEGFGVLKFQMRIWIIWERRRQNIFGKMCQS